MNDINKLKQILDNAPEGATHVDDEDYLKGSKGKTFALWMNNAWCFYAKASKNARSLSDLRTIVEQAETILRIKEDLKSLLFQHDRQSKRNAELEKDIGFLQCCVNSGEEAKIEDRPSYKNIGGDL